MKDAMVFWDDVAAKYAKVPISDQEGYEYTLARTRSYLNASDRVLEVGCGTGRTALQLAPMVQEIVATDLSNEMLEVGRAEAWEQCIPNVSFAQCDALAPPSGPYNVVLAHNILHLVEDLPATLAALHDALEPGGLLISKTFVRPSRGLHLVARLMTAILPLLQMIGKAPFVAVHRLEAFEAMVRNAGFEIIESANYPAKSDRRYLVARKR